MSSGISQYTCPRCHLRATYADGELCPSCLQRETATGVVQLGAYLAKWADFEREYGPNNGKERSRSLP